MSAIPTAAPSTRWVKACTIGDVPPWCGVAVLLGRHQIAIVRWGEGERLFAIGNFDPFSKAFVISRGIVGDHNGVPMIASPVYKQRFSLADGTCLDDPSVRLPSYPLRSEAGAVFLSLPG